MLNVDKRRATSSSNGGERMNEGEGEKATAWVEGDEGVGVHNNPISDARGLRLWPVISSRFLCAIGLVKIMANLAPGTELRHSRGSSRRTEFRPQSTGLFRKSPASGRECSTSDKSIGNCP